MNGAASLVVPPNALATTTSITLEAATGVPLDPSAVTGAAVRVGPAAVNFAAAATLVLRYDPALRPSGSDEGDLRIHVTGASGWQPLAAGQVDAGAHTASAPIGGGGTYGVRWPDPTVPCVSPTSEEFDFWLGSWNFNAGASAPGRDDISRESAGCLVQERFRDSNNTEGRSVSFVSALDGLWHQTYIDSRGGRQVLIGRFEDGQMRLYETATQRFNWLPQGSDRVRYFEEITSNGGATWSVRFDSTYSRR
jgi:hypothetical protein